jgi:hypothetical protein
MEPTVPERKPTVAKRKKGRPSNPLLEPIGAKPETGRPSHPLRDFMIHMIVCQARKMKRPKHPGLKPVQLSWEKAYEVVCGGNSLPGCRGLGGLTSAPELSVLRPPGVRNSPSQLPES